MEPTGTEHTGMGRGRGRRAPPLGGGLAAAVLLATALPARAAADAPFRATFREQFAAEACPAAAAPGMVCARLTGAGAARQLGRSEEAARAVVNLGAASSADGCAPVVAAATLTAADGDTLLLRTTGMFCPGENGTGSDVGTYAVVGGSGRFAHASGEGAYRTSATFGQGFSGASVTTLEGSLGLHR